jgi:hypothetical protein
MMTLMSIKKEITRKREKAVSLVICSTLTDQPG